MLPRQLQAKVDDRFERLVSKIEQSAKTGQVFTTSEFEAALEDDLPMCGEYGDTDLRTFYLILVSSDVAQD
ncbi:unnamed protein product [Protopolystoma xenopodis]|uniref:Uncharacterized protein n=1 Tax=Protopolystoma xenopodis TaxID=117903 RepID=A0A3S5CQ42_9PLAT|nr:unnamed protein product [Protopolystoma xenopodis]